MADRNVVNTATLDTLRTTYTHGGRCREMQILLVQWCIGAAQICEA